MALRSGLMGPLMVWFLVGAVFALAVVGVIAPQALLPRAAAQDGSWCVSNDDYGTEGTIEQLGWNNSDESSGTQAYASVGDAVTDCQRVSSVYVYSQSGNGGMEFGWVIGWETCGSDWTFSNYPRAFYWAYNANGTYHSCHIFTGFRPEPEQYDYFRVSDTNLNTYWGAFFNGDEKLPNGVNLDFTLGWSAAAMERGESTDSGFARWTRLREFHHFANGWSNWDDADDANTLPNDPGYHCHAEDANTVRIHPGGWHRGC